MRDMLLAALRASLVTWLLCGILYPLTLTGLAQLMIPDQANGSLEHGSDNTVIGSRLIGQSWDSPQWFHGRLSATAPSPYNAASSGGSNLGPTSKDLAARVTADRKALEATQPELAGVKLPADMLTASASGLDPDISPANAALQAARVAQARGVPAAAIEKLVSQHITGRSLGIFGEPHVNVLALNLALQHAYPRR